MLEIFSFNVIKSEGALLQSIGHGFVASALFLIIGVVYDKHHTRMIKYFGKLAHVMPVYTLVFFFYNG
jgi:NADH-quinone oxidoreductase subunit M